MARLILLLILATACGGSKSATKPSVDDASPTADNEPGIPAALDDYKGWEIRRWDRYTVTGVELWQVSTHVPDHSTSSVVGVDNSGKLVSGMELFGRVGSLSAAELVSRALDMLYGKAPGGALEAANVSDFFPAEQRAIVEPPTLADGTLVFWTVFGEMAPTLTQVRLDLSTGKDKRTSAEHVLNPPPDPLPPIRALLSSDDPSKVIEGLVAVVEHCELAPDVAALLRHTDARVRSTALDILGNLGHADYVPDIIRLMREGKEWSDRSLAGQKLLYFYNHPDALDALREHIATSDGQEVSVLKDALEYHKKNPVWIGSRPCER